MIISTPTALAEGPPADYDVNVVYSAMRLSQAVYDCAAVCELGQGVPAGYELVAKQADAKTGFHAAAYKESDGARLFVVYAGIGPKSELWDVGRSFLYADPEFALADQLDQAVAFADGVTFAERTATPLGGAPSEVVITGHSLGGTLAQWTGAHHEEWTTYTFNAPPLPLAYKNTLKDGPSPHMVNFVREVDWLTKVTQHPGAEYAGDVLECVGGVPPDHSINGFIQAAQTWPGLDLCAESEPARSLRAIYYAGTARAWASYWKAAGLLWADHYRARLRSTTAAAEPRTQLDADLRRLKQQLDTRLVELKGDLEAGLTGLDRSRDAVLSQIRGSRDAILKTQKKTLEADLLSVQRVRDLRLAGATSPFETGAAWSAYYRSAGARWQRYYSTRGVIISRSIQAEQAVWKLYWTSQ